MKPLVKMSAISLKYVKWVPPETPKDDEEDEGDFDSSDNQFKLVALVLDDHLQKGKPDLKAFLSENLPDFIKSRKSKIESEKELWDYIKSAHPENHGAILSALKGE